MQPYVRAKRAACILFSAIVGPQEVLGLINNPESRQEAEVIVDPVGLPSIRRGPIAGDDPEVEAEAERRRMQRRFEAHSTRSQLD